MTRQKASELLSTVDGSVVVDVAPSGDQARSPDHRLTQVDLCAARPRASVYRPRCVGLAAHSAKKVRRLSGNSGNLLTSAMIARVTIAATVIVV